MKKMRISAILSVCGLLAFGVDTLQAQESSDGKNTVNFNLTVRVQDLVDVQVGHSPISKSTIVTKKMTNKDILKLLEVAYSTNFPTGSLLTIKWSSTNNSSGNFLVVDKSRNQIKDATADGYFNNYYNTLGNAVYKDTSNDNNGNYLESGFDVAQVTFNDSAHTNNFTLSGFETYTYSVNGSTGIGTQTFALTGAGTGELRTPVAGSTNTTPFFLVNGTFSSSGKGVD